MIDKGYRLGLHGHQHKSDAGPHALYTSEKQVMSVVSAGSLCAAAHEIPPGFQRQYNIIEITDGAHGRLHVRQAQIRGVFGPGVLPGMGNPSYVDIDWTPVPLATIVNVGRGGGTAVAVLEEVEELMRNHHYPLAVERIDAAAAILGDSGRLLKTEALFRDQNWQSLAEHLDKPQNADEATKLVRALISLRRFEDAEHALDSAAGDGRLSSMLIIDLRRTVQAERAVGI